MCIQGMFQKIVGMLKKIPGKLLPFYVMVKVSYFEERQGY